MNRSFQSGLLFLASVAGIGSFSIQTWSQEAALTLPDSPSPAAVYGDPAPGPEQPLPASTTEREATWRTLPGNFLSDQKDIWLFPTQLARGRHWVPTLAVAGVTAGLIFADPHAMPYFRTHAKNLDKLNDGFDPLITTSEVILVPASLMVAGYIRHDQRTVSSALLCAQAYGDSAIVDLALKAVTRRERPTDVPPGGDFHNTFFNGGKSPFRGSSFPSGHSTGAFSVATVVAIRYQRHKWVPWAAYTLATAVSLSRITTAAHFPSDVFLGAALGYSVARFETLRPR